MKRPVNNDGTPRKQRTDCTVFQLPDEGKLEFADVIAKNPASPNVEQLEAVLGRYGIIVTPVADGAEPPKPARTWARKNLYRYLRGPRVQELTIAAGVIRNRMLGQTLADSGADALHADARRLVTAYWMTVARCTQEAERPKSADESDDQYRARIARCREEMQQATDNLATAGVLKSGEDKGRIAEAKLRLQSEKQKLDREKFEVEVAGRLLDQALREKLAHIAESNLPRAEKIAAARQLAFADIDALEKSGEVVLPQ